MAKKSEDSLRGRLCALDIGESVADAKKFVHDRTKSGAIRQAHIRMVQTMRAAVSRASNDTGHVYEINQGDFRTSVESGFEPVILVIATRVK